MPNAALAAAVAISILSAVASIPAGAGEGPSAPGGPSSAGASPPAVPAEGATPPAPSAAASDTAAPPAGGSPGKDQAQPGEVLAFRRFVDTDFVAARRGTTPIVLYFEADWCEPCKEMHARTFRDPAVIAAAAGMELFRFDMTPSDGYVDIMKNSFKVIGAPTVIVFSPGGKEAARRFGFVPPDAFVEMLEKGRAPAAS